MPEATARLSLERPARYLKQLIAHLGNRLETELTDPDHGAVRMTDGAQCVLTVTSDGLQLRASAPDSAALLAVQNVVTRHLLRFAEVERLTSEWAQRE